MSKGFIYLIENVNDETVKIGFTKKNVERRLKQLLTGSSGDLVILKTFPIEFGQITERYLHRVYNCKNIRGEWFSLDIDDVQVIEELIKKFEDNLKFLIENENNFIIK